MIATSGHLGILLLETSFPRIPGDVGNPASYDFPVRLYTVPGATVERVVRQADRSLLPAFIQAARLLESEGAAAITSSCGFLSLFQDAVAKAVKVPVFLSSLQQVPLVYAITRRRVAIITAHAGRLSQEVLTCAGIDPNIPLAVSGLEDAPAFSEPIMANGQILQKQAIEAEVLERSLALLKQYTDIGAYVFECHNLAPYGQAVQQATGLPVFDVLDFANWVHNGLVKRSYPYPGSVGDF